MPYDTQPMAVQERIPLRVAVIELVARAGSEPAGRDSTVHAALRELVAARPASDRLWLAYRRGRTDRRAGVFAEYGY